MSTYTQNYCLPVGRTPPFILLMDKFVFNVHMHFRHGPVVFASYTICKA
jgi:hypothetical protein